MTERLKTFHIDQTCKKDLKLVGEFVAPRLRASGRKGQRLSDQRLQTLSKDKTELTWATTDSRSSRSYY
eukprot:3875720-Pyramimonas_sp.AAC.1